MAETRARRKRWLAPVTGRGGIQDRFAWGLRALALIATARLPPALPGGDRQRLVVESWSTQAPYGSRVVMINGHEAAVYELPVAG